MCGKRVADAFLDEIRDVLSAERQLVKAMPKMIEGVFSKDLQKALQQHLVETEVHVKRVEQVFDELGRSPRAKLCKAMKGILEECEEMLEEDAEPSVKDAIIIALAQKVEHYEITTYGTLAAWAKVLDYQGCFKLLTQTLGEEEAADKKLSKLARELNQVAASAGE